jgi:hypothetical protein
MTFNSRSTLRLALATVLMIVVYAGGTMAQTPEEAPRTGPLPAPVGHRQPTLAEVPEDEQTAVGESDKDMRAFDRLLRICTGCRYSTHAMARERHVHRARR